MTGPRLGPRTHNARAPARHSSHSDETIRLYNALQQFFQTSPGRQNIALRRVPHFPQSFNIVAEFCDACLHFYPVRRWKPTQRAAARRRRLPLTGRDGCFVEPFPAPRQNSAAQHTKKGRSAPSALLPLLFVSFEPRTGRSTRGLSKFRPPRDRHSVRTPFLRFPPWPPADRRDRPAPPRSR